MEVEHGFLPWFPLTLLLFLLFAVRLAGYTFPVSGICEILHNSEEGRKDQGEEKDGDTGHVETDIDG